MTSLITLTSIKTMSDRIRHGDLFIGAFKPSACSFSVMVVTTL
jgi:hypothetical protein